MHNFNNFFRRRFLCLALSVTLLLMAATTPVKPGVARVAPGTAISPTLVSAANSAASHDPRWDTRFGPPGVDGGGWYSNLFGNPPSFYDNTQVFAVAVAGDEVFIGGAFTSAGGKAISYIARWNSLTGEWSALGGGGLNGSVSDIVILGDDVYVAGNFTQAGSQPALYVAKWNRVAQTWSALGAGLGSPDIVSNAVTTLAAQGNTLIAGGTFTQTGTSPINNVARWNGSAWLPLGSGTDGRVDAVAADASGNIYAGGLFDTAGGVPSRALARWNGSAWNSLGAVAGSDRHIRDIATQGNTVVVAGNFSEIGGVAAENIAQWNGSAWSTFGSGIPTFYGVYALTLHGNEVYAGGSFQTVNGAPGDNIAKWTGSAWQALGTGLTGSPNAIAVAANGTAYVGGFFRKAGDQVANKVARWTGTAWATLGNGANQNNIRDAVTAVAVTPDEVFAGGFFNDVGDERWFGIARWNRITGTWANVGGIGIIDRFAHVSALAASGNHVYVGGSFNRVGADGAEVTSPGIARWNRTSQVWEAVGGGIDTSSAGSDRDVNAIVFGPMGELYVGGNFTLAGSTPANDVARWNGSTWTALGGGIGGAPSAEVEALALVGNQLYAGGTFTQAGSGAANGLAVWDTGTNTWAAVDASFNGRVYALAVSGNALYVGGTFSVGALGQTQIARYRDGTWENLGGGVAVPDDPSYPLAVYALAPSGSDPNQLYVGGNFVQAGGQTVNGIAKWNGSAWSALGSGPDIGVAGGGPVLGSYVADIAVAGDEIFLGGNFTGAGGTPSAYVAHFDASPSVPGLIPRAFLPVAVR